MTLDCSIDISIMPAPPEPSITEADVVAIAFALLVKADAADVTTAVTTVVAIVTVTPALMADTTA